MSGKKEPETTRNDPSESLDIDLYNTSLFDQLMLFTESPYPGTPSALYGIVQKLSYLITYEEEDPLGELLDTIGVFDTPGWRVAMRNTLFKYENEFRRLRTPKSLCNYYLQCKRHAER